MWSGESRFTSSRVMGASARWRDVLDRNKSDVAEAGQNKTTDKANHSTLEGNHRVVGVSWAL